MLDTFSGAIPRTDYSFDHPLYDPDSGAVVSENGFSFHHDMGDWPTSNPPGTDPTGYESGFSYMGQEELQNWILSAGLYWSHSGDRAWLGSSAAILQACLDSMLVRDNPNADARDGITKDINERGGAPEITTFDDLGASLRASRYSGRLAVRNWACYLALEAMFGQLGDSTDELTCQTMAATAAQTIAGLWTNYQGTLGYIPALLDGSDRSAIIPMVEGLAYPLEWA